MNIIENYELVKMQSRKSGKCICGKRLVRSKTFEQTLNPFNKKEGRIKTREEILKELSQEKNKWQEQPVFCELPSYWKMNEKQREEYEKTGQVEVELKCGQKFIRKKI